MKICPICKKETISTLTYFKTINGKIKCSYCKNKLYIKTNFLGVITLPLSIILSIIFIRENQDEFNYLYLMLFWIVYFIIDYRFLKKLSSKK